MLRRINYGDSFVEVDENGATIGRIVHYVGEAGVAPVVGIVLGFGRNGDQTIARVLVFGASLNFVSAVFSKTYRAGCWSWPPRGEDLVTADVIREVRERAGTSLVEAKAALAVTWGDVDAAVGLLLPPGR